MASIPENISAIRDRIEETERRYGRPADSVRLLAVSKVQPVERILAAYECGLRDFGENYLQEALEKMQQLSGNSRSNGFSGSAINWHFIGPVQSNKTREIARHFHWVHSIDRLKIAERLNAQRPAESEALNVCVQVNHSGEETKSGISLKEAEALCEQIAGLSRLRLRGLMSLPQPQQGLEAQREGFRPLSLLFNQLAARFEDFDTLSIGTSGDFEAAIAEGSTLIRIGTSLFGSRQI